MFLSREKRQQRRQFKDFVRWLRELTDERRTFLIALCYRESQVRDLVSFFAGLSKEQQYDSLSRLGLTPEQIEQAIGNHEVISAERRQNREQDDDESYQLDMLNRSTLDSTPELLEPPRPLKKRIEMKSSVNLS